MFLEHLDTVIAFAVVMLLLSLIITTLVQMVSGLVNLRGRNLLWGTEQLLKQIDPRLSADAQALTQRILKHPALTSRWLATAIRPSELVLVLGEIARAEIKSFAPAGGANNTEGAPRSGISTGAIDALKELFQDKVDPDSPALEAKSQELIGLLTAAVPADRAQDLRSAVLQTFGRTSEIVIRVDAWFETIMDRTSERFKTWSRYITVVFALIFGLVLQVDSLALYKRLSTDTALRGRLLSMADSVSDEARKLIANDGSFATLTIRRVLQDPRVATGDAATKLANVQIPQLRTEEDGETWLRSQLAEATDRDIFLAAYTEQYPNVVKENMAQLEKTLSTLQSKVEATTPDLLSGRPKLATYQDPMAWIGMLMTVAFLSLGAPFWFNALRSLSALKPVVSQKLETEEKKTA